MIEIRRTTNSNPDFLHLLTFLDANLKINDGDEHAFFTQFNKLDDIQQVVVAFLNNQAVGCGAFKKHNSNTIEIKRVYVDVSARNNGIASMLMAELESWARELNFTQSILETGIKQLEAVKLYPKLGYHQIDNYPPYVDKAISICFAKKLLD
jgi:putative acetyltransferase